jgi:hypothetical protein
MPDILRPRNRLPPQKLSLMQHSIYLIPGEKPAYPREGPSRFFYIYYVSAYILVKKGQYR